MTSVFSWSGSSHSVTREVGGEAVDVVVHKGLDEVVGVDGGHVDAAAEEAVAHEVHGIHIDVGAAVGVRLLVSDIGSANTKGCRGFLAVALQELLDLCRGAISAAMCIRRRIVVTVLLSLFSESQTRSFGRRMWYRMSLERPPT